MLNFHFRMTPPTGALPALVLDDPVVILRMEIISPATNNVLFLQLEARYASTNNWKLWAVNDREAKIVSPSYNAMNPTNPYYYHASLGNSDFDGTQVVRVVNDNQGSSPKISLLQAETWDVSNQKIKLKYFATDIISPNNLYFEGSIGRIDFIGGFYDTAAGLGTEEYALEWKLPCRPTD